MKRSESLFLSALAHNRILTYVGNALDGAGSLSGFVAFIEERTHASLQREDELRLRYRANEALESLALLDYRYLPTHLTVYGQARDEFSAALPWFEVDPGGAHILALHSLKEHLMLWEAEFRRRDETSGSDPEGREVQVCSSLM